jgi:hypothetical protein
MLLYHRLFPLIGSFHERFPREHQPNGLFYLADMLGDTGTAFCRALSVGLELELSFLWLPVRSLETSLKELAHAPRTESY